MSGHSKWSTIKRKKGANDAARGKVFSKIAKEIFIASREGGGDSDANPRLRTAIIKARSENMPNDNIERAIKKGTGDVDGVVYEEIMYEGYGHGGVAILVQCLTDNKNRTGPDVRHAFSRYGGSLGAAGCVSYLFSRKGLILFDTHQYNDSEALLEASLESGADDVEYGDDICEVLTSAENFSTVLQKFQEMNYQPIRAEIALIPSSYVHQSPESTKKTLTLIETLDDIDDVQAVFHNLELSELDIEVQ